MENGTIKKPEMRESIKPFILELPGRADQEAVLSILQDEITRRDGERIEGCLTDNTKITGNNAKQPSIVKGIAARIEQHVQMQTEDINGFTVELSARDEQVEVRRVLLHFLTEPTYREVYGILLEDESVRLMTARCIADKLNLHLKMPLSLREKLIVGMVNGLSDDVLEKTIRNARNGLLSDYARYFKEMR